MDHFLRKVRFVAWAEGGLLEQQCGVASSDFGRGAHLCDPLRPLRLCGKIFRVAVTSSRRSSRTSLHQRANCRAAKAAKGRKEHHCFKESTLRSSASIAPPRFNLLSYSKRYSGTSFSPNFSFPAFSIPSITAFTSGPPAGLLIILPTFFISDVLVLGRATG